MNTVLIILSILNVFAFISLGTLPFSRAWRSEKPRGPLPESVFHLLSVTFLITLALVIVPMFVGDLGERGLLTVLKILLLTGISGISLSHKNTRQVPAWVPWSIWTLAFTGAVVATISVVALMG